MLADKQWNKILNSLDTLVQTSVQMVEQKAHQEGSAQEMEIALLEQKARKLEAELRIAEAQERLDAVKKRKK